MLTFWVIVLCCPLPNFVASSSNAAPSPIAPSALQRLYGEAAVDSSDLYRYLDIVENACLKEARSTARCLSCEALTDHTNALVCCKFETVYGQCQPIVKLGLAIPLHSSTARTARTHLDKRYRNRFLGKRSELEDMLKDFNGYDVPEDFDYYQQKRGKLSTSGGRRPNNFLGKRLSLHGKRRNTFLGKRNRNLFNERWGLEEDRRAKRNLQEKPYNEIWKK